MPRPKSLSRRTNRGSVYNTLQKLSKSRCHKEMDVVTYYWVASMALLVTYGSKIETQMAFWRIFKENVPLWR